MIETILRTLFFYFIIVLAYRIMGKREVGQLGIIDLIVSILIAELVALGIEKIHQSIWMTLLPICVLVIIELILGYIAVKSRRFSKLFGGKPTMIISDGKIVGGDIKSIIEIRFEEHSQKGHIENLTNPSIAKTYSGDVTTDSYGRKVPKHAHGTVNIDHKTSSCKVITEREGQLTNALKSGTEVYGFEKVTVSERFLTDLLHRCREVNNAHSCLEECIVTDFTNVGLAHEAECCYTKLLTRVACLIEHIRG